MATPRAVIRVAVALPPILAAAACAGPQHVLDPRGPAAARIAGLWWVMLALALAVCVAVVVLLALAVRASRTRAAGRPARDVDARALVLVGGVGVPAVILFAVLLQSYRVGSEIYGPGEDPDALVVEVVGHLFWWEVRYPQHAVVTANEIHVPAGRPVVFRVSSPDVIHSFWIPQLHGKIDMIPGQVNTISATASEPGRFRGQCAEFCGDGHALMALWLTAHEPAAFDAWLAARSDAAAERASPQEQGRAPERPARQARRDTASTSAAAGRRIFRQASCGDCHSTPDFHHPAEQGATGPDLSDLATRATLAAGTIPNTRPMLRAWIGAPQRIKPGSLMPPTDLPAEQMEALLDYLETLR